jgi:ABC-2 type transport system permease protein
MTGSAHQLPAHATGALRRFGRAWRVAWKITRLNFRARLEYRGDFVTAIIVGLLWQASVLVFAGVLLTRFPGLGGWTSGGVLLIAAMRLLSHGVCTLVFQQLWEMTFLVPEGRIDGYLVRPMPVYRQLLLSEFPVNAFGDSAAGVLTFALALTRLHLAWTLPRVAYLVAGILGGILVEASLLTVFAAVSLRYTVGVIWFRWLDSVLGTFSNYPLRVLPTAPRAVLTFVIPVAFIAYLPAAVITGRVAGSGVASWLAYGSPLAGLLLYLASRRVWSFGLRHYQSIGG